VGVLTQDNNLDNLHPIIMTEQPKQGAHLCG